MVGEGSLSQCLWVGSTLLFSQGTHRTATKVKSCLSASAAFLSGLTPPKLSFGTYMPPSSATTRRWVLRGAGGRTRDWSSSASPLDRTHAAAPRLSVITWVWSLRGGRATRARCIFGCQLLEHNTSGAVVMGRAGGVLPYRLYLYTCYTHILQLLWVAPHSAPCCPPPTTRPHPWPGPRHGIAVHRLCYTAVPP
jgi:hypothetical protein